MPLRSRVWTIPCALALGIALVGAPAAAEEAGDKSPLVTAETPVPFGFNYGEVETTRALALAGAMRAAGNGTTSPFMNPANMALSRVYHIEALATVVPEFGRQVYGGVIVDSITNRLAGGIAVTGGFLDLGDAATSLDRSWLDVRLALAYPIADVFNVGIGGRYLKVTQDGLGPLGDGKASGGLKDPEGDGRLSILNLPTFDAGVSVKIADLLVIGASGQNLTFPDNGLMPTTVGGGVAVATDDFTIEADGNADFNSYGEPTARVMAGGEYLLLDHVPLRLGYRYDQGADSHALSGGVGYIAREFMIEASVRRTIVGPEATTMVFQVGYFLESSGLTASPDEPAP
jgi:hypothetical protein